MDREPRLLTWNYTVEEQNLLETLLREIGAPPAVALKPSQGDVVLRDVIHSDCCCDTEFVFDEKILLFYNIPQKGVVFLINTFKQGSLPRPIYAVVTEHSIDWPFRTLAEHLVEEREAIQKRMPPNTP